MFMPDQTSVGPIRDRFDSHCKGMWLKSDPIPTQERLDGEDGSRH